MLKWALYDPDTSVTKDFFQSLLIGYGNFCFYMSCIFYFLIFIRVDGSMGEWPNNLRQQLTQQQNDNEAGAVLGKKTKNQDRFSVERPI